MGLDILPPNRIGFDQLPSQATESKAKRTLGQYRKSLKNKHIHQIVLPFWRSKEIDFSIRLIA